MTKTTYGRELLMDQELLATRVKVPEQGSGCACKFKLEDEYGEHYRNRAHRDWDVIGQNHDDPGWRYYLECHGCGYQWANTYWKHDHLADLKIPSIFDLFSERKKLIAQIGVLDAKAPQREGKGAIDLDTEEQINSLIFELARLSHQIDEALRIARVEFEKQIKSKT